VSVLLVDIGNTRIKWALWHAGRLGTQRARPLAGWSVRDLERRVLADARLRHCSRVLVASVGREHLAAQLARATRRILGLTPELACSVRRAAGITTCYVDPWRLGVDRLLGAIAAHQRAGARPVCAASIGTAVTLDLIDASGVHRGGAIAPGPELMVRSLLQSTEGIARRARQPRSSATRGLFARSTRVAIEQGARFAVAALIERGLQEARQDSGQLPLLLLTGGAAPLIAPYLRPRHVHVPDLVLRGLALYGGLTLRE